MCNKNVLKAALKSNFSSRQPLGNNLRQYLKTTSKNLKSVKKQNLLVAVSTTANFFSYRFLFPKSVKEDLNEWQLKIWMIVSTLATLTSNPDSYFPVVLRPAEMDWCLVCLLITDFTHCFSSCSLLRSLKSLKVLFFLNFWHHLFLWLMEFVSFNYLIGLLTAETVTVSRSSILNTPVTQFSDEWSSRIGGENLLKAAF